MIRVPRPGALLGWIVAHVDTTSSILFFSFFDFDFDVFCKIFNFNFLYQEEPKLTSKFKLQIQRCKIPRFYGAPDQRARDVDEQCDVADTPMQIPGYVGMSWISYPRCTHTSSSSSCHFIFHFFVHADPGLRLLLSLLHASPPSLSWLPSLPPSTPMRCMTP